MTYSATFFSQSGVLNIAARAGKPVLASSGPSPLRESVEKFNLGAFVEPDSSDEIRLGIERLLEDPQDPDWEAYAAYASWNTNVEAILRATGAIALN